MATITQTELTTANSINNGTSRATASVSPTADSLVLAIVSCSSTNSGQNDVPTCAGAGMTWVEVANVESHVNNARVTMFRAMDSSPSSGALTFTFANEQAEFHWTVQEFDNVDVSGANGSGAIRQVVTNAGGGTVATSGSATLAAFGNTENATVGIAGTDLGSDGDITHSVGTGFTLLVDKSSGVSGSSGLLVEWRNDNDTSVDGSWTPTSYWGFIGIELQIPSSGGAAAYYYSQQD